MSFRRAGFVAFTVCLTVSPACGGGTDSDLAVGALVADGLTEHEASCLVDYTGSDPYLGRELDEDEQTALLTAKAVCLGDVAASLVRPAGALPEALAFSDEDSLATEILDRYAGRIGAATADCAAARLIASYGDLSLDELTDQRADIDLAIGEAIEDCR